MIPMAPDGDGNDMADTRAALVALLSGSQKVAICCVGNTDAGDDGAGMAIAPLLDPLKGDKVLVFECGQRPDSYVGDMAEFKPSVIIIVDAAEMDGAPGTLRLLEPGQLSTVIMSTHSFMVDALIAEISLAIPGAKVMFLCIQVKDVSPGSALTGAIRKGMEAAAVLLNDVLIEAGLAGNG